MSWRSKETIRIEATRVIKDQARLKLFGCHFLASIREYSCSFVAKILFRAGRRPQTTKPVSFSISQRP
jgi:hypothetical protein